QTLSPKTNLHWLASRAALAQYFSNAKRIVIYKDAFNKPSMRVDDKTYQLSITHSNQYAAVLFSTNAQVSLDLEKTDPRVVRVAKKFVNNAEDEMMKGSLNDTLDYTRIWSAKETLYKFYGIKELDFKLHMTVFINNVKTLRGCIHKVDPVFFDIRHEQLDDYVLTYIIQ
ncbi:MAG: 4'-phosphopantetheinyl transferase superfamily protein, partial [Bacteroidota bacterium]